MTKKHLPAAASAALFAALALTLVVALSGPLTAGAETSPQVATVTPAAAAGQRA